MKSLVALIVFSFTLHAAEPGLEIRLRPAADIVSHLEFLGGCVGQAEAAKNFADVVKVFGGAKGVIEGLDLKRPIGAFAVFTPAMVDSQIVAMVPVADEKAVLNLMTTRMNITPEKQGDGSYFFQVPGVGPNFYLRFHKDYAYLTIQDAKHVKAESLPDPKVFFGKPNDSLAVIALHIDRLPNEVRRQILGQMELTLADKSKQMKKDAKAFERLAHWAMVDGSVRAMKSLLDDGKTLTLRLNALPKTDDVALGVTLTAKDKSELQSTLAKLPKKSAKAALTATAKEPVVSLALNAGLPDAMNAELAKHVDEVINEIAKADNDEALEQMLDALAETMKAGDYELGAALTGDGPGSLRLVAAMKAVKGGQFDRLIRDFSALIPATVGNLEIDALKQAAGNLHKFTSADGDLKKYYGSDVVWAHLGDSLFVIGLEPDGKASQAAVSQAAATSDVLNVRVAWSRLSPLVEKSLSSEVLAAIQNEVFGKDALPSADATTLRVTGGDALTITLNTKSKSMRYLQALEKKKKQQ